MKLRRKILVFLAVVPLLFLTLIAFPIKPTYVKSASANTTKKVMAVVYDNSGSMTNNDESTYAKFALQGLMSVMSDSDLLTIFPLNPTSSKITVDLTKDRNEEVQNIIHKSQFTPTGGTPHTQIGNAITWLKGEGLNEHETVEGKEFWLVVLTDGTFANAPSVNPNVDPTDENSSSKLLRGYINGYVGLQTAYFAIGSGAQKIPALVASNSAVSQYEANKPEDIIKAVQEITNRTTGRYTMTNGVTINGNVVEVDLSACGFSVVSLAVIAQGESGALSLNSVTPGTIIRPCSISSSSLDDPSHKAIVNLYGCTATVIPNNNNGYFNGEKLILEFSSIPKDVKILVEPAITLEASLQYLKDGKFIDTTEEEINSTFKKGETIRADFKLLDSMTGADLTNVLTNTKVTVSYNGQVYDNDTTTNFDDYSKGFTLVESRKEIALSVDVDINGSKYTLYKSFICDIDANPQSFRIDSNITTGIDGDEKAYKVEYKVFVDNTVQLTKEQLEGDNKTYEIVECKITDPLGGSVPCSYTINQNGTITVNAKANEGGYGNYKTQIKVKCIENKRTRTSVVDFNYYPTSLILESGSNQEIRVSLNQLKTNDKQFDFTLKANNGMPIDFSSGLVKYKLTVDGVDVTSSATISQNVLSFIPTYNNLPNAIKTISNKNVVLEVYNANDQTIRTSIQVKLDVTKPIYAIVTQTENTEVDIFDLDNCNTKLYFTLSLDGVNLTKEELQSGLDSNAIKVEYDSMFWLFLSPGHLETTVVDYNGAPSILVSLSGDWGILNSISSAFMLTGEKPITVTYADTSSVEVINLTPVPILAWARIWRVLVMFGITLVIVYIVLYIVGFFVAKPLPKGVLVKINFKKDDGKNVGLLTRQINFGNEVLIWHLSRLNPFKLLSNQPSEELDEAIITINKNRNPRIIINLPSEKVSYNPQSNRLDASTFNEIFIELCDVGVTSLPTKNKKLTTGYMKKCLQGNKEELEPGTENFIEGFNKEDIDITFYVIQNANGKRPPSAYCFIKTHI